MTILWKCTKKSICKLLYSSVILFSVNFTSPNIAVNSTNEGITSLSTYERAGEICKNSFPDFVNITRVHRRRRRRFVLEGSFWEERNIFYRIRGGASALRIQDLRLVFRRAFTVWEEGSFLRFIYNNKFADIEISFLKGEHGDGEPFDGKGQILAHAFFPRYGGEIHFDDDEQWSLNSQGKELNLYTVAVHEIGHALGMKHSKNLKSVMSPTYRSHLTGKTIHLAEDDLNALNYIYGGDSITHKSHFSSNLQVFCAKPNIDATLTTRNDTVFVFVGDIVYEFDGWKLNLRNQQLARRRWPGIPKSIDAAISTANGDNYIFKRNLVWIFSEHGLPYSGSPFQIENTLENAPSSIDAAFALRDIIYFFKGEKFWRYSLRKMARSLPRSISSIFKPHQKLWQRDKTPSKIDSALRIGKNVYLIRGEEYYKVMSSAFLRIAPGYPKKIGEMFVGCN